MECLVWSNAGTVIARQGLAATIVCKPIQPTNMLIPIPRLTGPTIVTVQWLCSLLGCACGLTIWSKEVVAADALSAGQASL